MVEGNHWDQWFSDGFGVRQPFVTMGFNGCAPLVWGWNGYVPSSKSIVVLFLAPLEIDLAPTDFHRKGEGKEGENGCISRGEWCWGACSKSLLSPFSHWLRASG